MANGCEVDLRFDAQNCGTCGKVCQHGFNCNNLNCGCPADHQKCNGGAPANTFQCVQLSGADKCKCADTLCEYGQLCNAQSQCAW